MRKAIMLIIMPFFLILLAQTVSGQDVDRDVLISRGFKNHDTYIIVCKGYPDESLPDKFRRANSAREAALINAQTLARQIFNDSVDIAKWGMAIKYVVYTDYTVIHYQIKGKNLRKKLRRAGG